MSRIVDLRLRKLEKERANLNGPAGMTRDELLVRIYELSKAVLEDPDAKEEWDCARQEVDGIAADIIETARRQTDPDYQAWLDRLSRKRGGKAYVLALTGGENGAGEYADMEKPRIMERRAALRNCDTVQGILRAAGIVTTNANLQSHEARI